MATLVHKTTGQVMADIANVQGFLAAVSDPDQWESDEPVASVDAAPVEAATEQTVEQPETIIRKVEDAVAPVESALASAVHAVESGLETILHKIEGDQQ